MGNGEEQKEIFFSGYHGTHLNSVKSIFDNGFWISDDDDEWLGRGIYFFIDNDDGKAKKNAINYAIKIRHKRNYAVLLAKLSVAENNVIDYDIEANQILFHNVRDGLIKILIEKGITVCFKSRKKLDCLVFNEIHQERNTKVALRKVFINFDKYIGNIEVTGSDIPNCRIMCVIDNTILDSPDKISFYEAPCF